MTAEHLDRIQRPYGSWPSPISAASLVEDVVGFSELTQVDGRLYWLESRPQEAGRCVLMTLDPAGPRELTPAPYNVRSRVHEYGGGAYAVQGETVYFVNFHDQNLYRRDPDGQITPLTHSEADVRFADFIVDTARERLISVVEQHVAGEEPENLLAAVDLRSGAVEPLARGHDFYASPRLAPGGERLVFIAWDHPNMPWDGSMLWLADVDAGGALNGLTALAGSADESVLSPGWQSGSALLFLSDANGYWNLYRFDASGIYCVLEDGADYAEPPWNLGTRSYAVVDAEHLVATRLTETGPELVLVNAATTMATPLMDQSAGFARLSCPCIADGAVHFIGASTDHAPVIARAALAEPRVETLLDAGGPELAAHDVSRGELLRFPTRDGAHAYGYFYRPRNGRCQGPAGARPPLLVVTHGGPTAMASNAFSLRIQYYTTRGWAVLDVNYRGSSGFGRDYRRALNGHWGELDVTDCEDAVRELANRGWIDPERVAIRGGSAGGYTTLSALTRQGCFRAGASHYGIGDLNALARDTHKFESRYLSSLLGDLSNLESRSPIQHLDQFRCPTIFFQGSEDKVVPPNQSRTMAQALRERGVPVAYLEFPGEGHGFRDAAHIVQAVEAEYAFFCRVFRLEPAEDLPDLAIDNAENL